ncbi:MAG: PEP-CTERM sorting domain-containing protein [Rubripirellula sp.]
MIRPLLIACTFFFVAPAYSAISWNITFEDVVNNTGVGFDDATFGASRQSTFNSVLNYINSAIDANGNVDFTVNNSQTDGGGSLASAGTLYFTGPNGFSNGLLFQHATTGVDPFGGANDGSATFDFGYNWNSELDAPTPTEFDLFTVSLHEVTHAMGFASLVNADGNSEIDMPGGNPGGNPGVFSVFDTFLELGDGTDLFSAGGSYDGTAADLISDDVFFSGANAVAANGGAPVKMYAPTTFNDGSSISHFNQNFIIPTVGGAVTGPFFPGTIMSPAVAMGVEKRAYTALDLGVLQDIGWTVSAVPEPSSFLALAIVGAGAAYRKRRKSAKQAA